VSNATGSPTVADVTALASLRAPIASVLRGMRVAERFGIQRVPRRRPGRPFQQINTALEASTNYTDSTVVSGATYYYVTTAVNAEGQQSAYSNAAKAVVP